MSDTSQSSRMREESPVDWFLAAFQDYEVSFEQLAYAHYLETRGKRFCIDFGFENAEDLAWQLLEEEPYEQPIGHA